MSSGRGFTDQVFVLKLPVAKYGEKSKELYIVFADLGKEYDEVY